MFPGSNFESVSQFTLRCVKGSDLTNIEILAFILSKGFKVIPMLVVSAIFQDLGRQRGSPSDGEEEIVHVSSGLCVTTMKFETCRPRAQIFIS